MNRNVLLFEYDKINLLHVIFWYKVVDKTDKNNCDKKSPPLLQGGKSSHSPVGPWVCLCVFWVAWFKFMFMYVLFYLGQLSHFPSCFGAGVTNLNEPPSSFLLPPHYCGLGAGSIHFRAIANNKQCEMRGLFMSLVIHYWIGDVQDCQGVSVSEMTYIVSGEAFNSTHSLKNSKILLQSLITAKQYKNCQTTTTNW